MKLSLLFLLLAGLGLAQNSITIRVVDNGVEHVARITGAPAAAGIEVVKKWMATQENCVTVPEVPAVIDAQGKVTTPAVPASRTCSPRFANPAETGKEFVLGQVERLSAQFPSSALTADIAEAAAKQAIVEAKRKALFDAARAEK